MKKLHEVLRWLKHPHWTWWIAKWTYAVTVCVAWGLLRLLLPGMTFWRFIVAGLLAPPVAVGVWYIIRFGEWVVRRVRVTLDAGIPLSPVRMLREFWSERKKFADAEERWALAMRAQKVIYDGQSPKLHRMTTTAAVCRSCVRFAGRSSQSGARLRTASTRSR